MTQFYLLAEPYRLYHTIIKMMISSFQLKAKKRKPWAFTMKAIHLPEYNRTQKVNIVSQSPVIRHNKG
jgi:hypothetical protein